ncbi:MAG: hypothetical protein ACHWZW_13810 [Spirulina sp.]
MLDQSQSVPDPDGSRSGSGGSLDGMIDTLSQTLRGGAAEAEAYLAIPEVIQHPPKRPQGHPRQPSSGRPWRWLLLSLLSCLATSAAAVGAFLWLVSLPPSTNCDDPTQITTNRAALSCAQRAADDGDLESVLAGLALVQGWGTDHWLSHEIDPLVEEWSAVVVAAAEQELRNGNRDEAEALIGHIPTGSSWYSAGQNLLAGWNQEWEQGAALVAKAQTAMAQQDWRTASAQVLALGELSHPHWREEQVQAISRQIQVEQQAHAQIRKAVTLASPGGTDRLIEALGLVNQVSAETLAHQTAQTYRDRWSDLLLAEGLQRWYNADLDRAVQIGQVVARNPNRAKVAQELIWLSQGRKLARQSIGDWKVNPHQMATIYRAMLLVNRIASDSPYYPQAQSSLATWRTHLEGMGTLQLAQLAGGIHQADALKLAIRQAETIPPNHPRRMQAQTLLAHWRQDLERMEDAPYLAQAHQFAKANTPEGLRQAIASASQITSGRALRQEAQGWVYLWTQRLQTQEDQPVLDRAYALAEEGKLSQAVVEASTVLAGRALHDEAQAAITEWERAINRQEQARYPVRRRAVAPLVTQPAPTPSATAQPPAPSVPRSAPAISPPAVSSPPRPASQGRPSQLPDRIETVPGNTLPAATPPAPATLRPVEPPPRPLVAPAPVNIRPTAPAETSPPPTLVTPPPASVTAPEPTAAPAPIQVPPPSATPAPPDPEPTSQGTVEDPSSSLESRLPSRSGEAEVLYTGALYMGL